MMIKMGFELEAFCLQRNVDPDIKGDPILVPASLPYDECGWLVEVRSEPHFDVRKALALLRAETKSVQKQADSVNVDLLFEPLYKIPRELKVQASRLYTKGLIQYKNIYGHETHKCKTDFGTASLHVSVTNEATHNYDMPMCKECHRVEPKWFKYQGFIDHAKLIVTLDKAFKDEIAKAKRNPGFYEIKSDGRIEYRSLPNNVDLDKLEEVLVKLKKEI